MKLRLFEVAFGIVMLAMVMVIPVGLLFGETAATVVGVIAVMPMLVGIGGFALVFSAGLIFGKEWFR